MLKTIIRGTTPTIQFTFKEVDVSDVTTAYLNIGTIEKDLSTATVGDDTISWTLSQSETLGLSGLRTTVQLNWKTSDGTRGASEAVQVEIAENAKNEVI